MVGEREEGLEEFVDQSVELEVIVAINATGWEGSIWLVNISVNSSSYSLDVDKLLSLTFWFGCKAQLLGVAKGAPFFGRPAWRQSVFCSRIGATILGCVLKINENIVN